MSRACEGEDDRRGVGSNGLRQRCTKAWGNGCRRRPSLLAVWFTFGMGDILQRHCRSVLGPLWITASTAVMMVLYAERFRANPRDFIPPRCRLSRMELDRFNRERGGQTLYQLRAVRQADQAAAYGLCLADRMGEVANVRTQPAEPIACWLGSNCCRMAAAHRYPGLMLIVLNAPLPSDIGMVSTRFRNTPQIIAAATPLPNAASSPTGKCYHIITGAYEPTSEHVSVSGHISSMVNMERH